LGPRSGIPSTPAGKDPPRKAEAVCGTSSPAAGIERIFGFVRDEIAHSFDRDRVCDLDADATRPTRPSLVEGFDARFLRRDIPCRASEVLALGHGLCHAKSHLLAALLRFAGHPTGFCYARLVDDERPGRFVLHGFNALYWQPTESWILLDARGDRDGITSDCRFEAPFSLAYVPDLERVPDFDSLRRNLPDRVE
jgi:hypothetical protein